MSTPETRLIRAQSVLIYLNKIFTFRDYVNHHPLHKSTAYRDWRRLISIKFILKIGYVNTDTRIPLYIRSQVR